MDGKKKLEELVAGLEGVTPGPWYADRVSVRDDNDDHTVAECPDGPAYANAAHLSRCEPDAIRSISDAYKAMERERDTLRALIALAHPVMRACGWHLAIASAPQGDGVLEAACTEVEDKFAEALKDSRHEG